jgi:hypothetical protein
LGWAALAVAASVYAGAVLMTESAGSKAMFLPGATTAGHYQIELACSSCHTPFGGVANDACVGCHGEELSAADDSHPKSKFTDPRNAELVSKLDATRCVTCHREHAPAMTRPMGVTLPDDFCVTCHGEIGIDRPSHAGMAFNTCASAGCHNYHDNTALYEDFLAAHADEPAVRDRPLRRERSRPPVAGPPITSLAADAPAHVAVNVSTLSSWESTSHARARVNCSGCHTSAAAGDGAWIDRPGLRECETCHTSQRDDFLRSRHGMRLAQGLTPMMPAAARRPMKPDAAAHELSCVSCHGAHDFDTRRAAVEACVRCHDDGHTRAYAASPHARLWTQETGGASPPGSGVSCATCHLPRVMRRVDGTQVVFADHNQNATLRPNEKMVRTVCLDCHGLAFSIDALADPALIAANFTGTPLRRVAGIAMATSRLNGNAN